MRSALRSEPGEAGLRLTIAGNSHAIRRGLSDLFLRHPLAALCAADRGTAEIVLAEVLNNIAEHGYAGQGGLIELNLVRHRTGILCTVIDKGIAMPDGALPRGELKVAGASCDLSEGGYGWFLIRTLTRDLRYRRWRGRNELRFRLVPEQ